MVMAPDAVPPGANRLEISVDTPPLGRQRYIPGDVVEGEIALWNPYRAAGLEASISFVGVSKVRFREKGRLFAPVHTHEDEIVNWRQPNLARTKQPNPMLWRFRVPIPSSVTSVASSRFTEDETFANSSGYPLPPSFHVPHQGEDPRYVERDAADKNVTVVYILIANLTKPYFTHSYSGPTVCQMHLSLSSLRSLQSQAPALQIISSSHHISPYKLFGNIPDMPEYNRFGVAENHILFWNSMKPSIDVDVSIPKYAIAGRPLDVHIRFRHNLVGFEAEKLAPLILHTLNMKVTSTTQARVPGVLRHNLQAKWEQRLLCCSLDITQVPDLQRSCLLSDFRCHRWDVTSLIPKLNEFTLSIPSFKTSNLAYALTLNVWGELRICDETIRFNVKEPVIVLPRYNRADIPPSNTALVLSHTERSVEAENDAPPPYREHPNGASELPDRTDGAELPSYAKALDAKA
ncbi:MAG: hypothetical protein Q9166_000298 [cf. Caloplaca sp. 2 TL-2023]